MSTKKALAFKVVALASLVMMGALFIISLFLMLNSGLLARVNILNLFPLFSYNAPHAYKVLIFSGVYLGYFVREFKDRAPFIFIFIGASLEVAYHAASGISTLPALGLFILMIALMMIGAYLSKPQINTKIFKTLGWYTVPLVLCCVFWVFYLFTGLPHVNTLPWTQLSLDDKIGNVVVGLNDLNFILLLPILIKKGTI